jgi:hypothetical protein
MNCPLNGNRCSINKTHHRLFLANSPSFFIFNLDYNQNNNNNNIFNNFTLLNILKCFILISKSLNIPILFEENSVNKKNDYNFNKNYELTGIIFLSLSKIYSCAFKVYNSNNNNILYNYYVNEIFHSFNSFYDLVFYSLKNGLVPLVLIYEDVQISNSSNLFDKNDNLSNEQILNLEKYCLANDNLFKTINQSRIRINENILSLNLGNYNNNMNNNPSNKDSNIDIKDNNINLNHYQYNNNKLKIKNNQNYNLNKEKTEDRRLLFTSSR